MATKAFVDILQTLLYCYPITTAHRDNAMTYSTLLRQTFEAFRPEPVRRRLLAGFESRIAGIPCRIEVTHYSAATPHMLDGHPDNRYEGDPEEFDFDVLDRRGRRAPWLERKLTDDDVERIRDEYLSNR